MKYAKKVIILVVIIIILLVTIPTLYNNFILHNFAKQLYNYKLPQNTEIIYKCTRCGKLNGNGDAMDYLACIVVKTDLEYENLIKHYDLKNFKPAKNNNNNIIVEVEKLTSKRVQSKLLEHQSIYTDIEDFTNCYSIILYDGGYSNFLDIRGT